MPSTSIRSSAFLLVSAVTALSVLAACTPPRPDPIGTDDPLPIVEEPREQAYLVYFGNTVLNPESIDCAAVFPVERSAPEGDDVIPAAARSLLAGPTAEERDSGYTSFFSSETAGALRSVRVQNGTAYVDLADIRPIIPNASTSCGSAAFLSEIYSTLTQFPEIDRVILAIEGDPEPIYEWLQIGCAEENDNCDRGPFEDGGMENG
jgi:hypothetical protein